MARRSNRKRRKPVPVPVASMGDIAFLLIIFFLVCSEVAKDKTNLEVTLPLSEYVEKQEASVAARVAVDEAGQIFLDGEAVGSPKDVEWGVRAMLASTVADDQRHVQFKCDAKLPKDTFEPVLKAIAEAGGIIDAVGEKQEE
ncbi:MAG: biopolymer transporter ExbD [Verrucomicrobia bacterium]|jgi:biopolymer transport protein ExbD|nr:biopolymer transporter ExbD [Verrucomicrobiota bacterium]